MPFENRKRLPSVVSTRTDQKIRQAQKAFNKRATKRRVGLGQKAELVEAPRNLNGGSEKSVRF